MSLIHGVPAHAQRFALSQPPGHLMLFKIRGLLFVISDPYGVGHRLSANEAQALNALRTENVRNNVTKFVDEALAGRVAITAEEEAKLQARIDAYASGYDFPLRRADRGLESPQALLAREIARDIIKAKLVREHLDLSKPEIDQLVEAKAQEGEVQEEAARRITRESELVNTALDGLAQL